MDSCEKDLHETEGLAVKYRKHFKMKVKVKTENYKVEMYT